jgi:hypothetical protein
MLDIFRVFGADIPGIGGTAILGRAAVKDCQEGKSYKEKPYGFHKNRLDLPVR